MIQALLQGYQYVYGGVAGIHPFRRPWHSQWLSVKDIYADLRRLLPELRGRVLDVGCMQKPYAPWLTGATAHVGIDVFPGRAVDHVIRDGERWPLETGSFQAALATQVVQVIRDVPNALDELHRVLEDGGIAVFTIPWCYNDMSIDTPTGRYKDYWRHSVYGAQELLSRRFEILEVRPQGGVGSTVGVLLLNWIHQSMSRTSVGEVLFATLLPGWLLLTFLVNAVGWVVDKVDRTGAFYHNVLVVARKKNQEGGNRG